MSDTKQKPIRKRRWLSYSLRTLLVAMTILCVALGYWVHRANRQQAVVKWVRANGGYVYYDYDTDEEGRYVEDAEPPGPEWLRTYLGNDYFGTVILVQLGDSEVKDVAPLTKLEQLERLSLSDTPLSDLTPLAGLRSLQDLALTKSQISDLTPLSRMSSLRSLWLANTPVSDLTPISGLISLENLNLANTPVSDFSSLVELKSLEYLSFDNTQISDLTPLSKMKNLTYLHLANTPVSDLTPLAGLTSLEFLNLQNTQVNQKQINELQKALPKCKIFWTPPAYRYPPNN